MIYKISILIISNILKKRFSSDSKKMGIFIQIMQKKTV